jgi:phage terminase large subunit-like protein
LLTLFERIFVKHVSGGTSELLLKSYDQGGESFQGTNCDLIWLDEETDRDIYLECLLRTMTTNGIIILTFTPLMGVTDTVRDFINHESDTEKYAVQASWSDVPHLTDAAKGELRASIPPYQREARSKGVPQLGSGAIYQVPDEETVVANFEVPVHWPRAYELDSSWRRTAAL